MILSELTKLLNENYLNQFDTKIIGGFDEPFYQTYKQGNSAEIQFTQDYFSSALHELSHWCVAGIERRKVDDYGYWYIADGRNQQQQNDFFIQEVKPQTIEWAFSIVCGINFEPSVDNLNNTVIGIENFKQNLLTQMQNYLKNGFTTRTNEIFELIASHLKVVNIQQYKSNA